MAKVMNTVFGIGIAIILFIVVLLGTQVFYKAPVYEDYCNQSMYSAPIYGMSSCPDNITVGQCNILIKQGQINSDKQNQYFQDCNQKYQDAEKVYGKNIFIINNIFGIIFVIASLFLFSMVNIAAGTAFAGLALIVYGFMRGWQGIGDTLKFIVALIVAILFVYFAIVVNRMYSKKSRKK